MCVDTKRNQIGRALWMVTAGLMAAGLIAAEAHGQSYILSQNGKGVGSASLQMGKGGSGFSLNSETNIDMPGLKYKFKQNETLDGGFHLAKDQLDGSVNGTSAKVDTALNGQQFVMRINANGNVTNTPLAFHPQAVLLPDFDPGGLQVLLNVGAAHNNANLWALIPKQTGSTEPLRIATNADMQGNLDGRAIPVHHLTVTFGTSKTELFSSPQNDLLQAEWTDEGFAMVRKGFKLTPPAKPGAPPPAPAQPAGQAPQAQPQGQAPQPQ